MPKFFFFFILFNPLTITSQEIKGIVKDNLNHTIHLVIKWVPQELHLQQLVINHLTA